MIVKNTRRKTFHFTAAGYVVSEGKVLLVSHRKLKKWLPPGGHLVCDEAGQFLESPEEAVLREVSEETGFNVEICGENYPYYGGAHEMQLIPESMHIHPIDEEHDHFGFDFFCRIKERNTKGKEQEKYRWFSEKELENYPLDAPIELTEHVRVMALKAMKKMGDKK